MKTTKRQRQLRRLGTDNVRKQGIASTMLGTQMLGAKMRGNDDSDSVITQDGYVRPRSGEDDEDKVGEYIISPADHVQLMAGVAQALCRPTPNRRRSRK